MHQLSLGAHEIRAQEVQEKLRFVAPQEEVVHQFEPVILVQRLSEEILQEGPSILLRMEGQVSQMLGKSRVLGAHDLLYGHTDG